MTSLKKLLASISIVSGKESLKPEKQNMGAIPENIQIQPSRRSLDLATPFQIRADLRRGSTVKGKNHFGL